MYLAVGATLAAWIGFPSHGSAVQTDFEVKAAMLEPVGKYYEATVPDTLDLAERARLSVHGLTSFLNEKKHYEPYGHGFFNTDPPYLSTLFAPPPEGGGAPNWGKIADAILLTRSMCGSRENLDIEAQSFTGMIRHIRSRNNVPAARMMLSMMSLYQKSPDPQLRALIQRVADDLRAAATIDGDYAYYFSLQQKPEELKDTKIGVFGFMHQPHTQGSVLRVESRWAEWSGAATDYQFADKLKNHLLRPEIWHPEAGPKVVVGDEHGQCMGHIHSYAAGLMGLIRYAEATRDARLMEFVREGYEYLRQFGIARIGLCGEMCNIGDMTYLAVKLSRLGVGDYWEDVDQYVRNQLAEGQVTDAAKLQKAAAVRPVLNRVNAAGSHGRQKPLPAGQQQPPLDPVEETADNVCQRFVGAYLTDNSWPTCIPRHRFGMVVCCSGNATMGLYAVWDGIVDEAPGATQVNLLLNRAAESLDVDSYLPYEGKVVIRNKTARRISVRMPRWVDAKAVKSRVGGQPAAPFSVNRYLVFTDVKPRDEITITFPMVQTRETYTLKWKKTDFWQECTNPGMRWKADDPPARFTFTLRGNTVVDVAPREDTDEYRLYERDFMKKDKAPLHAVTRFVTATPIKW
jgi:hypothetical protein